MLPPATKASFGERGAALSASWGPVVGRVTARATSAWTWTSWAVLTAHAYLSKAFWFAFDLPITAPRLIWTGLVAGVKFVSQSRLGSGVLRGIVAAYRGVAWAVTTVLVNPLVKALDGIWFVVDKVGRFVGAVFYKIYETVLFRLRIYDAGKVVVLGVRFVLLKIWASIIWVFVNLNRLPLLVFRGASWGIAKVLAVVAWVVLGLLGPTGIVTRFLRMIGVTALANRAWRGLRHVALLPLSLFRRSAQSTSGFLGYLWKSPREQRRSPLVATILFIVRLPGTIIWTVVVRIPRAIVMGVVGGVRAVLSLLWHYTFGLVIHPAQPKGFLTHLAKLPKPRPKGTFLSELKRLPAPRLQLVRLAVNALTWPFRFVYKWTTRIVWTLLWPFRKGFSLLAAVARFFLSPVQRLLARLFAPVLGLFGGRGGSSGFLRDLKRLPGKKSSLLVRVVTAPFWGPVWLVKQLLYLVFLVLSSPFRLFAYLFGGVGGGGGAGAKAEGGMSLVTMLTMPLWGPLWLVKTLLVLLYKGIVFALVTLYKIVVFVLMIPIRVLAFPLRMIGLVR